MSAIKVGDTFTDSDHPGCAFLCIKIDPAPRGNLSIESSATWHRAETCRVSRVTVTPIKTPRKIKPSELRAWHRSQENWMLECGEDRRDVWAWTPRGDETFQGSGPTEAKAIIALRKALRAKGVTV